MNKKNIFQQGQSLFEVIIALAITTVIIIAMVSLATNTIRNTSFSRDKTLATRYVQEAIEWSRGQRDSNWDSFYLNAGVLNYCLTDLDFSQPGNCLPGSEIPTTNFKREVKFTPIDSESVDTKVTVYWEDTQGYHEVISVTSLTNWRTLF